MLGLCARGGGQRNVEMAENSEIERSNDDGEPTSGSVTTTTPITTTITTTTTTDCQDPQEPHNQTQQSVSLQTQAHLQPTTLDAQGDRKPESSPSSGSDSAFNSQRVFKKSLPNNKLTLYLVSRDLVVNDGKIDTLQGVLLVDPEYVRDKKVYGQVTLTFRYGREDEEVMGLKFCTEAIVYRAQLYPPYPGADHQKARSSLQLIRQRHRETAETLCRLIRSDDSCKLKYCHQESLEEHFLNSDSTGNLESDNDHLATELGGHHSSDKNHAGDTSKPKIDRPPITQALIRRLGPNSHAFSMEIPPVVPPSVRLLPAKEYNGAPIGTSYDVKAFVAERVDEKLHRNATVRMGIRVLQRTTHPPLPANTLYTVPPQVSNLQECNMPQRTRIMNAENEIEEYPEPVPPHAAMEKPFLLSGGAVRLEAWLDRAVYAHGDTVAVHVNVTNDSHKSVKRLQVLVLQHVDVCMFTSGKFKNVVAAESEREGCPIGPGSKLTKIYTLRPMMGTTKNWIALEDNYTKAGTSLASTVVCTSNGEKDKDPFAINVSYYVKVKLLISLMGGVVSLKLPFTLMHRNSEPDLMGFSSPVRDYHESADIETDNTKDKGNGSLATTNDNRVDEKSLISPKKKLLDQMADLDLIEHSEEPMDATFRFSIRVS